MNPLDLPAVRDFVNDNIGGFHQRREKSLAELKLDRLLTKNPYLFKAKDVSTASEMINGLLDAFLSSSEEQLFGGFLEGLAGFVAQQTSGGHKSTAEGVDLEFFNKGIHYVVSVKSGPNWGNASQHNRLQQNLTTAVSRLKQLDAGANVQPVLGCVDISPQTDESGSEMKEAKVSGVQLLKPGEYPPVMLYFVDEAFHQMTLPV